MIYPKILSTLIKGVKMNHLFRQNYLYREELIERGKIILYFLIFCLFVFNVTIAGSDISKSGTTSGVILEIPASPRGLAMGSAVIANSPDAAVFYWNPALATQFNKLTICMVSTPWLVGTHYNYFSTVIPTSFLTVGAYISTWSMPDMKVRNEYYPLGTGDKFSAGDIVIGVAVARDLTDHFTIGGTIKYIQERIWHSSAYGFALDFGSIFLIDIGNGLRIGTTLMNYGTEMKLAGRDLYHYHDPNENMDGNNESIISGYVTDGWGLPLIFKIGISTDLVNSSHLKWVVEIDARHPSNNYESLDFGTEIIINKFIALRCGAERLFLKDENISFGVGFGLKLPLSSYLTSNFDYGFRDYNQLGYLHSFGLEIGF
ncbi:MAG: PorV/PorQ family protein [Candidatus Marinimicrobia bacterium]|nr:PorV/PorQ family protein [Candidatus Neomarinimicrobiota bacterium]